jgi:hypothetical protein
MGWKESWQNAIKIPVHKKGNNKEYKNYRGINLVNSGYDIFVNIIKIKLYAYLKNKVGKEQNGSQKDNLVVTVISH